MKIRLKDKIRYSFDKAMSKGTGTLFLGLLIIVLVVTTTLGVIAYLLEPCEPVLGLIWDSFTHMLDPGVISGVEYDNYGFLVPMLISTIFGVMFTATLIGIINASISEKLEALKKGESKILDNNHYIVIGYNERIFNMIMQFIISFKGSWFKHLIVVIGDEDKSVMEDAIRKFIKANFESCVEGENKKEKDIDRRLLKQAVKSTTIVCRRGKPGDKIVLDQCNVANSRAIVVNEFNDFSTMKTFLAINSIAKEHGPSAVEPYIIAVAMKKENAKLFMKADKNEYRRKILFFSSQISRITAHSCLHPGVSVAIEDLFNYGGNEIYIEKPKGFEKLFFNETENGEKIEKVVLFRDILNRVKDGVVIGFKRNGELYLNPDLNMRIYYSDDLILISDEPRISYIGFEPKVNVRNYNLHEENVSIDSENILVMGCNENLAPILAEQNKYMEDCSTALIACNLEQLKNGIENLEVEKFSENLHILKHEILNASEKDSRTVAFERGVEHFLEKFIEYQNKETITDTPLDQIKCHLKVDIRITDIYSAEKVDVIMQRVKNYQFEKGKLDHILVLSDTTYSDEEADEKTLFLLMSLRYKFNKDKYKVNITTEMRKAVNQNIANTASADDFIISDNIISNMVTQIARNEDLYEIFENILNVEGAEIYLEPIKNYITFNNEDDIEEFNFYEITKIVTAKDNKIPIGYRIKSKEEGKHHMTEVVINPKKERIIKFAQDDLIVVVANEQ